MVPLPDGSLTLEHGLWRGPAGFKKLKSPYQALMQSWPIFLLVCRTVLLLWQALGFPKLPSTVQGVGAELPCPSPAVLMLVSSFAGLVLARQSCSFSTTISSYLKLSGSLPPFLVFSGQEARHPKASAKASQATGLHPTRTVLTLKNLPCPL